MNFLTLLFFASKRMSCNIKVLKIKIQKKYEISPCRWWSSCRNSRSEEQQIFCARLGSGSSSCPQTCRTPEHFQVQGLLWRKLFSRYLWRSSDACHDILYRITKPIKSWLVTSCTLRDKKLHFTQSPLLRGQEPEIGLKKPAAKKFWSEKAQKSGNLMVLVMRPSSLAPGKQLLASSPGWGARRTLTPTVRPPRRTTWI